MSRACEVRESGMRQQILVSGLGGQGVLFVSRLLADAAIRKGFGVLTSEIHGMAQRGGTVVSHLKIGGFPGPLIRPGHADGVIVLREENLAAHGSFLAPGGWAVVNASSAVPDPGGFTVHALDAEGIAAAAGSPRGANLVLLGFLLSRLGTVGDGGRFFCSPDELRQSLDRRFGKNPGALEESLGAFDLGIRHGKE